MSTKIHLLDAMNDRLPYLSQDDVRLAISIMIKYITDQLSQNRRIEIRGFGSFGLRKRKYRGQSELYNVVYYKMSKDIREHLKE
ncbi:MAG: HU family DNA-binding protein [Rickettsiaceae bacterium]